MGRVCAIGIDAASIDLIDELCDTGALPHFAALRGRAARTRLHSAPAHRHGMLWTQFVTGRAVTFERSGFRSSFDPDTYEVFEQRAHHEEFGAAPFWETSRVPTITFDVPRTTISGPGVHVTSWGAHAPSYPRASEPRGLLTEIDARFGIHPGFENDHSCGWHDQHRLDRLEQAIAIGAARRADIACFLMERFPDWQLFVTVMSEAHSASEMMWHGIDATHPLAPFDPTVGPRLARVFEAMDRSLGTILAALRTDDTVMIFSLDGMQSSHSDLPAIVLLPELMHRRQFGTPLLHDPDQDEWRRAGFPPLVPRRGEPWRHDMDRRLVHDPARSWIRSVQRSTAYETARQTKLGRRVVERVKRAPLGALGIAIPTECRESTDAMETARDRVDQILFIGNYRPYWRRMRSFALPTFGDGYIRMNLRDRDSAGLLAIADYDDERRALDELIRACRNPRTGLPVTDEIEWLDAETALEPGRRPYADGIVRWTHPIDAFEHPDLGMVGPFPMHRTGAHHEVGFLWAAGPGVTPGVRADASVLDIPPTILRVLDPSAAPPPSGVPISVTC